MLLHSAELKVWLKQNTHDTRHPTTASYSSISNLANQMDMLYYKLYYSATAQQTYFVNVIGATNHMVRMPPVEIKTGTVVGLLGAHLTWEVVPRIMRVYPLYQKITKKDAVGLHTGSLHILAQITLAVDHDSVVADSYCRRRSSDRDSTTLNETVDWRCWMFSACPHPKLYL